MTFSAWPNFRVGGIGGTQSPVEDKVDNLEKFVLQITQNRQDDISQFTNLAQTYVAGRRVGKIPSSSTDVASTDNVGDVSYAPDGTFRYDLVTVGSVNVWRRTALQTW